MQRIRFYTFICTHERASIAFNDHFIINWSVKQIQRKKFLRKFSKFATEIKIVRYGPYHATLKILLFLVIFIFIM